MTLAREKEVFRKTFNSKRLALTSLEVVERSRLINQNFISNLLPKIYQKNSNQIFSLYFPLANEVKTSLTAEYFEKHCIKFSYPKIIQKNRHLDFILHQENQPFVPN
jgi:5-formyltetrahydrofolate cyclo-ligase